MALTAEQVKNNLINQILYNFPTAETNTGSVLRDIFVDPQSVQISNLSEEIDDVKNRGFHIVNFYLVRGRDLNSHLRAICAADCLLSYLATWCINRQGSFFCIL